MELTFIQPGKEVYILNDNKVELYIVRSVHIFLKEADIGPKICYYLREPRNKDRDAVIQRYPGQVFESKEKLIQSL